MVDVGGLMDVAPHALGVAVAVRRRAARFLTDVVRRPRARAHAAGADHVAFAFGGGIAARAAEGRAEARRAERVRTLVVRGTVVEVVLGGRDRRRADGGRLVGRRAADEGAADVGVVAGRDPRGSGRV